jgi:hypothetical protein
MWSDNFHHHPANYQHESQTQHHPLCEQLIPTVNIILLHNTRFHNMFACKYHHSPLSNDGIRKSHDGLTIQLLCYLHIASKGHKY